MNDPILITGGATRLGLALATQYLENDQPVVITYRKYRPEIETLKSKGAKILYADFSSDEGIYLAAESLSAEHSRLKSIVHNASTWRTDPGREMGLHNLALMMRIHVGVSMILTDALAGALLASSNASVVNISDYVAGRGSANHMAYAASKSALVNLTKSQAKKYSPRIRINALCPALLEFREEDDATYRFEAPKKSSLGIVPGFDVAIEAILYLQENIYTTGIALPLDGGRPLKMP